MKKKMISFLCIMLLTGLLAACQNSNKGAESSNSAKPGEGINPTEAPAKPTKFSIARGTLALKAVESVEDINKDKWVLELEKRTNTDMDIQLLPHKDFKQKVSLMFAGGGLPDVLVAYQSMTPASKDMKGAVEAGIFMPLDDILKSHGQNLLNVIPKEAWDEVTYNGHIYSIPQYLSVQSRRATFVRSDLLEKAGIEAPKTIDDLLPMLRAFKKLGIEQPFGFRENFKYADFILGAYDVLPYSTMYEKQGDEIVPKFFDSENMMKALEMYKAMYDEGLMAKDFATITGAMWTKSRDAGNLGIYNANANQLGTYQTELTKSVADGKLQMIPSPTGPDGKGGMMLYNMTLEQAYLNAELSKEKAEAIVSYFDYMVSEEGKTFFTFGNEGETYTKENGRISYQVPTDEEERYSEQRRNWLWIAQDGAYNADRLPLETKGEEMLNGFVSILPNEGRGGVFFDPELDSYTKYPDLAPKFDEPSKFLLDHMIKMVYGDENIADWPKVVEAWKKAGGNEIIKEATERFNNKSGVVIGPDANVQ
ncbi:putative aldouronate transport system substrate-binding protein [Paenibacillus castaneae]|uniref:extracellular solute-binding protein n=1 Tax=Paenibacillus castaneae TaxID=474957 RepID=UPI000C9BFAB2|nr:extracellular solute-binding protein [Paenibacillus castaneae]NIK78784.1 putative aldouronate transport system substrate-binding protein [Paenibacillus castaneae]